MKTDIENKIGASQSSIETKMNEVTSTQSSIESKINELTTTVNTEVHEIKCSFDDLKTNLSTDIDTLKQHVTEQHSD